MLTKLCLKGPEIGPGGCPSGINTAFLSLTLRYLRNTKVHTDPWMSAFNPPEHAITLFGCPLFPSASAAHVLPRPQPGLKNTNPRTTKLVCNTTLAAHKVLLSDFWAGRVHWLPQWHYLNKFEKHKGTCPP